ncbi:hypothetical protein GGS20DRAFT_542976 [Poronia punctata]|nr:hypothetical protein GGS20DRAFT_542976 [Poronia punctata]
MFLLRTLRRAPLIQFTRPAVGTARTAPCRPSVRAKFQITCLRFETNSTRNAVTNATKGGASSQPPGPKLAYGERLCVYHSGTTRITFLSCLKLSTLFIFVFFGFVVTPAYYQKEGLSPTVTRAVLSAVVPLAFVAYTTSPFVTFIHMRLPPFARQSEEMLRRYVRTIPPQTELQITTMSFIAKPRVSTVKLSELVPAKRRFGIVTLTRDTTAENAGRKWYMFRAVRDFNVGLDGGTARLPWVWESIRKSIAARQ